MYEKTQEECLHVLGLYVKKAVASSLVESVISVLYAAGYTLGSFLAVRGI